MSADEPALRELYAKWLDRASKVGFALCVGAFILYAGGLLPATIRYRGLRRRRRPCAPRARS